MTRLLLFLWFPLSVGIIYGMHESFAAGMALQHLILLVFPAYGIFRGLILGKYFHCALAFIAFAAIFIHAAIYNLKLSVFIKLLATIGVVQWAYIVAYELSFKDFVRILTNSAIFFFFVSLLFIVLFPEISRQYFWGEYVLTSFYNQKNTYGRFLTLVIIFCFFNYLLTRKIWFLGVIALAFLVMVGTSSRTSIAMSIICILVIVSARLKLFNFGLMQLFVGLFLCAMFYGIATQKIYFYGLGTALDGINIYGHEIWLTGRATIWNSIFYQLTYDQKWMFGYGLDLFFSNKNYLNVAFGDIGLGIFMPSDPHNGYIDVILSYGVVGILLWVTLILYLLNSDLTKQLNSDAKAFAMMVIVVLLASNVSESFIVKSTNFYCFLFFYLFFMKEAQDRNNKYIKH